MENLCKKMRENEDVENLEYLMVYQSMKIVYHKLDREGLAREYEEIFKLTNRQL